MPNPSDERKSVAKRAAHGHFTATDQHDALVRVEKEKQRAKITAKIAKLRSLRLAKEHADKQTADAATTKTGEKSVARKRRKE
jgi:hypothetical protein